MNKLRFYPVEEAVTLELCEPMDDTECVVFIEDEQGDIDVYNYMGMCRKDGTFALESSEGDCDLYECESLSEVVDAMCNKYGF